MKAIDISDDENILFSSATFGDFKIALGKAKSSVSKDDLLRFEQITEEFGTGEEMVNFDSFLKKMIS
jgi:hypothetical protein